MKDRVFRTHNTNPRTRGERKLTLTSLSERRKVSVGLDESQESDAERLVERARIGEAKSGEAGADETAWQRRGPPASP